MGCSFPGWASINNFLGKTNIWFWCQSITISQWFDIWVCNCWLYSFKTTQKVIFCGSLLWKYISNNFLKNHFLFIFCSVITSARKMWVKNINHLWVLCLSLWRQGAASADCRLFAQGGFLFPYKWEDPTILLFCWNQIGGTGRRTLK